MVTYEAMDMLLQFGMFLAMMATAIVAIIALYTNRKK
ncbi:putative holin-like toxin [Sporosarcina sp. ITBMC105]